MQVKQKQRMSWSSSLQSYSSFGSLPILHLQFTFLFSFQTTDPQEREKIAFSRSWNWPHDGFLKLGWELHMAWGVGCPDLSDTLLQTLWAWKIVARSNHFLLPGISGPERRPKHCGCCNSIEIACNILGVSTEKTAMAIAYEARYNSARLDLY